MMGNKAHRIRFLVNYFLNKYAIPVEYTLTPNDSAVSHLDAFAMGQTLIKVAKIMAKIKEFCLIKIELAPY